MGGSAPLEGKSEDSSARLPNASYLARPPSTADLIRRGSLPHLVNVARCSTVLVETDEVGVLSEASSADHELILSD